MSNTTGQDNYHWYLCVEERPLQWRCKQTTANYALKGIDATGQIIHEKQTMALTIPKYVPSIMHDIYLKGEIKNQLNVRREI